MRHDNVQNSDYEYQNEGNPISRLISLIGLIFDRRIRKKNILYLYRARVMRLESTITDSTGSEVCASGCYVTVKIVDKNIDNTENSYINNLRNCTGENLLTGDFVYISTNNPDVINSQNSFVLAKI